MFKSVCMPSRSKTKLLSIPVLALSVSMWCLDASSLAGPDSPPTPIIDPRASLYDGSEGRLILKGAYFQPGVTVLLDGAAGQIKHGVVEVIDSRNIIITSVEIERPAGAIDAVVINPDGEASLPVRVDQDSVDERALTEHDVRTIIAQAVTQAEASGLRASIAVVDKEGNVLGVFNMEGRTETTLISPGRAARGGLEGAIVPSDFAAIAKAGTGAFLSSQGHSFTTRTAGFIVQQHFPPGVNFVSGGPLFGVQFSQLPCGDINPALPLGLSADPGGVGLYKNGVLVGGIGVEGDGIYTVDPDPTDQEMPVEELVAVAGTRGYETPAAIRADQVIANGIRFPFVNAQPAQAGQVPPFDQLRGTVHPLFPIRNALRSKFQFVTIDGLPGRVDPRFFPFKGGSLLSEADVQRIIVQAARQASITRAAIRRPLGSAAEVNIAVTDLDGRVLGLFSTPDAPMFGFDVSVQKARTAAFFSSGSAGAQLRNAEGGSFAIYVEAAERDGLRLDGSVAFTDRSIGF